MFGRLRALYQRIRSAFSRARNAAGAAIAAVVGVDELVVLLALGVLLVGLWPRFGRESLIVAGAVLLWMFLPSRGPFVVTGDKAERKKP